MFRRRDTVVGLEPTWLMLLPDFQCNGTHLPASFEKGHAQSIQPLWMTHCAI